MRVGVDDPWCHEEAVRVDDVRTGNALGQMAHVDDPPVAHADIGPPPGQARAVDDDPVLHDQVVSHVPFPD